MSTDKENFELVAKTFRGLEEVLASELRELGAENVKIRKRAVVFESDKELMYRANFHLRTALRVLKPVFSFRARDEDQLYKEAYEFDWTKFLSNKTTFAVDGVLNSPYFNHSQYIALKVKDAIADQFRERTGLRPSVDTGSPDVRLNLHISGDNCTILLDSSGESLHKRGYRTAGYTAPINEVLAAGLVKLTGWRGESNFLDPMCGSGTIVLEAAMMAANIPPGLYRKEFGFEKWGDFDPSLYENVTGEELPERDINYKIIGSDISPGAVKIARANAKNAFLHRKVEFRISSIDDFVPPEGGGIVVVNPPYGERIKNNDPVFFHSLIGDNLKNKYAGYRAWILSGNTDAIKHVGLKPSKKLVLYNGPLECRFHEFEVYSGSKKQKKNYKT